MTYTIGKFRLSVTTRKGPLPFGLPDNVKAVLAIAEEKRDDKQKAELTKYFRDNDAEIKELDKQLAEAKKPLPIDGKLKQLRDHLAAMEKVPRADPKHDRLVYDLNLSTKQREQRRLTGAQDLAWALINTPAFLFNH